MAAWQPTVPSPRPPSLATACSRAHARLPRTIATSLLARAGFGKYLNIKFNTKYQIMGAEVRASNPNPNPSPNPKPKPNPNPNPHEPEPNPNLQPEPRRRSRATPTAG